MKSGAAFGSQMLRCTKAPPLWSQHLLRKSPTTPQRRHAVQMPELKTALRARSIRYPADAEAADLVELLTWADGVAPAAPSAGDADAAAIEAAACAIVSGTAGPSAAVVPGTQQFVDVASAAEAAREKAAAGENRAVEHVALHDEAVKLEAATAAAGSPGVPLKAEPVGVPPEKRRLARRMPGRDKQRDDGGKAGFGLAGRPGAGKRALPVPVKAEAPSRRTRRAPSKLDVA